MNFTPGKTLLFTFCLLLCLKASAVKNVNYFIAAHQDDWQLFMGLDAYNAMNDDSDQKVVFIHLTAGDATFGAPVVDKKYYLAREKGAIFSIEFALDIKSLVARDYIDTVLIAGHPVRRFAYKNVVDYFLRLPDGCFSSGWGGQSLEYLRHGRISNIMPVDSTTQYRGWADLVGTMREIMEKEAGTCTKISLHVPETDGGLNPGDHPDHLEASIAAQEAARDMPYVTRHLYIGYQLSNMPVNVDPEDVALKAAIYGVTEFGRIQNSVSAAWNKTHIAYLCRRYERTIPSKVDSILNTGGTSQQVVVYPNPASNDLYVAYKTTQTGTTTITITAMGGQSMMSPVRKMREPGNYQEHLDISGIPSGVYIVNVTTPSGQRSFSVTKM